MFRTLAIVISGNATSLRSALVSAAHEFDVFNRHVSGQASTLSKILHSKLAVAFIAVSLALGGVIGAAVQFEQRMRNVNSLLLLTDSGFAHLSQNVRDLAKTVPQSATDLADAMYDLASSGFTGAEATLMLKEAAIAASAGLTDAATATRALAAVTNAYGLEAEHAQYITDVLFQTVNLGVITFEQLAHELGDVVGTAAAATVGIDEVGAAIATMTRVGLQPSEAFTSLNRVLQTLLVPNRNLAGALQSLGYESGVAALEVDSLETVMGRLYGAVGGNVTQMLLLFPEIRSARGALGLMARAGEEWAEVSGQMTDADRLAGAARRAFNEQMRATASQLKIAKNEFRDNAITIGNIFLPALRAAISGLSDLAGGLASALGWMNQNREVIGAIGLVITARFLPGLLASIPALKAAALGMRAFAAASAVAYAINLATGMSKTAAVAATFGSSIRAAGTTIATSLTALITPANIALVALAGALLLNAASAAVMRREMEKNDDAIRALTATSAEAIENASEVFQQLSEQDYEVSWWQQFWADFKATDTNEITDNIEKITLSTQARIDDLQSHVNALKNTSAEAALALIEAGVAAGDLQMQANGAVAAIDQGNFDAYGTEGVTSIVMTAEAMADLNELIAIQNNTTAMAVPAIADMSRQTGLSATQMADALNMPIEQFIELIEETVKFGDAVRESFSQASNIAASFDPTVTFEGQFRVTLQEELATQTADAHDELTSAMAGAEDASRGLEEAEYGLGNATNDLADAQSDAGRAVEDAARANAQAADAIVDAEESLADAHGNVEDAQEALTEAREKATEQIEELRGALERQADSEAEAQITVARARAELARLNADPSARGLERRSAEIALRDAERALEGTREAGQDTAEALAEMEAAGVEGSDLVVAAQERLLSAQEAVHDATVAVAEAHTNAARTAVDGANQVEAANARIGESVRGVEDAQRGVAEAQTEVATSVEDTAKAVELFQQALAHQLAPGSALQGFIENAAAVQQAVLDGVAVLAERGLDPQVIADLLAEAPERALPIIEAMLADHSGRLIAMTNEGVGTLKTLSDQAAEIAQVAYRATQDIGDAMVEDLSNAMRIAEETARQGTRRSAQAVSDELGIELSEVQRISDEYAISLISALDPIITAVGGTAIGNSYVSGNLNVSGVPTQAAGGYLDPGVFGGTPGRDSILINAMPREFVQPVASVDWYGPDFHERVRKRQFPRSVARAFAVGGMVEEGTAPPGTSSTFGGGAAYPYGQGPDNMGNSTFGGVKPWVAWSGNLIRALMGVQDIWGVAPRPRNTSDHPSGHALDFMTYTNKPLGDAITGYLVRNAVEHSIKYLIWQQQINSGGGWHFMEDRGSITQNHLDHVHASYMARAQAGRALTGMPVGAMEIMLPDLPIFPDHLVGGVARDAAAYTRAAAEQYIQQVFFGSVMGGPVDKEANRQLGKRLNAERGWDTHWPALDALWYHESKWDNVADNPTSTAYGIAQFLDNTWATVGAYKTDDPFKQIMAGLDYIAQRPDYGNPTEAWRMWQSRSPHWYGLGGLVQPHVRDGGGPLLPGFTFNGTGAAETVVSTHTLESLDRELGRLTASFQSAASSFSNSYEPYNPDLGGVAQFATGLGQGAADIANATALGGSAADIEAALEEIEKLQAAYEEAARAAEETAQRDALWAEEALARAVVEAALAAEAVATDEDRAILTQARMDAEMAHGDALSDIIAFDTDAAAAAEARAVSSIQASLQVEQQLREEAEAHQAMLDENREQYEFEHSTAQQQLAILDERIAAEEKFSDEWVRLVEQRAGIVEDEAQNVSDAYEEMVQAAKDAAEAARDASDEARDELERALEEYDRLIAERLQLQQDYDRAVTDAIEQTNTRLADARRNADDELNRLRGQRTDSLMTMGIDQKFVKQWGNTVTQLSDNIEDQLEVLEDWQVGITELRNRGVSEDIIAALGLEDPSNIGQLDMLRRATNAQLDLLNQTYASKKAFAEARAVEEQSRLLGAIGLASTAVQSELTTQIEQIWTDHFKQLDDMEVELDAELVRIAGEIAVIGQDTGRNYAESMADALATGLPAVIALAEAYEDALARAIAADLAMPTNTISAPATSSGSSNMTGRDRWTGNTWGGGSGRRYDLGGIWPSGTWGYNASGSPETVRTAQQERMLVSAPPVQLMTQIIVVVDGDNVYDAMHKRQVKGNQRLRIKAGM